MDCIHHLTMHAIPTGFIFQGNQIWSTQFPSSVCTSVSVFWAVVSIGTRKLDLWPMKRDAVYSACRCQKNKWKKNPYFKLLLGIATITCMQEHHMYSHRAQKAAQDEQRQGSGKSQISRHERSAFPCPNYSFKPTERRPQKTDSVTNVCFNTSPARTKWSIITASSNGPLGLCTLGI